MLRAGLSVSGLRASLNKAVSSKLWNGYARVPNSPVPRMNNLLAHGGGGKGSGGGKRLCATGGGGPGDDPKSVGLWGKYLQLLDSHPFLTRTVTCAVLNGLGDIVCQLFLEKSEFNAKRTLTFTMMGLLFVGPCLFYWYGFLGKLIPGSDIASVLGSLFLDQVVYAPVFIGAFMAILTTIEGKPEQIQSKLQQDLLPAVKANWILWVPAQFINFKFVPANLRVLATNMTALIWNVYMSYTSHKAVAH